MADKLALLKRLTMQKKMIQYKIESLTEDKVAIEERIDDIINSSHATSSENHNYKSLSCRESKFTKPLPIHSILAEFLGVPIGTLMSRTEVTRRINKYIRENNLRDKENYKKIFPDEKLKKLFKMDDNIELTFYNIQKYISPLFKLDC
jgi:chromatin remodeling complex protein RSC6